MAFLHTHTDGYSATRYDRLWLVLAVYSLFDLTAKATSLTLSEQDRVSVINVKSQGNGIDKYRNMNFIS
ncbi:hypothetical protein GCM10009410_27100 [Shewanella ulleungensis]|uniref:Uncharacterized protein n=1 Tax=Shewanella ulleungensis TaxID=2282699 RepID=A0ABQ2QR92_9GAMM|nr:hypothetical protein GCM10009410_27100 [Shewanella ulleungensis]